MTRDLLNNIEKDKLMHVPAESYSKRVLGLQRVNSIYLFLAASNSTLLVVNATLVCSPRRNNNSNARSQDY